MAENQARDFQLPFFDRRSDEGSAFVTFRRMIGVRRQEIHHAGRVLACDCSEVPCPCKIACRQGPLEDRSFPVAFGPNEIHRDTFLEITTAFEIQDIRMPWHWVRRYLYAVDGCGFQFLLHCRCREYCIFNDL